MPFPAVDRLNEKTLLVTFAEKPSEDLSAQISLCWARLKREFHSELMNSIPASTTLLLEFRDKHPSKKKIATLLTEHTSNHDDTNMVTQHFLPVYYHPSVAPDLEAMLNRCSLSLDQFIRLHSEKVYRVFAVGFIPGFAYLGEVDEQIVQPRLATPRADVAPGSVGIAENITGIYPRSSPGGWNIIGRCPLNLSPDFKSSSEVVSSMFKVGDKVSFNAIDKQKFDTLYRENQQ